MNRPTRILKITYALLMAGGLLTSCSSDDDTVQTKVMEAGKTYTMTVTASKGNNEAAAIKTRALSLDGNTLSATWAKNEQVFFRDRDWNIQFSGSLNPQSAGKTVLLNGEIKLEGTGASWTLPDNITLIFPRKKWDYTGQVGTLEDIAANYDYATAEAEIRSIEANHIEATQSVKFANQQSIVKFTLTDNNNPNATFNVSSLRISAKGLVTGKEELANEEDFGDITVTPTSATSEVFAALRGINGAQVTLTATVGSDYYIFKRDNVTFGNGTYRPITVKMRKIDYPVSLSEVTQDHIGSVVGQNGNVYPNVSAAVSAGTNAVAMIAYVGDESDCTHGLAIALTDENRTMIQSSAIDAARSHATVSGGTWRLPTIDDWQYMLIGCGNGATYSIMPGTVDYTALNSKLGTVGTALHNDGDYWSSDNNNYYCPSFDIDGSCDLSVTDLSYGNSELYVRMVLAF